MSDAAIVDELVKQLASKCEVALRRDDPVILVHTGALLIVKEALAQAGEQQAQQLAEHRSHLEMSSAKSISDMETTATSAKRRIVEGVYDTALATMREAAAEHLASMRKEHDRQLTSLGQATTVVAVSAAICVGAAALIVLS